MVVKSNLILLGTIVLFSQLAPLNQKAIAGPVDVVGAKANKEVAGTYRFDVTVKHADTGWKHYANKWQVLAPNGDVLGTRILHHPHVNEQPFTRSLSGVKIPENIKKITIKAFDNLNHKGGKVLEVNLKK